MDLAPRENFAADPTVRDRYTQRAQALGAVKFMGLTMPVEFEPEPPASWIARFSALLFRA